MNTNNTPSTSATVQFNSTTTVQVGELLASWNLTELQEKFAGITLNTLICMTDSDLNVLFPNEEDTYYKCRFQEKLIDWRKENGYDVARQNLSNPHAIVRKFVLKASNNVVIDNNSVEISAFSEISTETESETDTDIEWVSH